MRGLVRNGVRAAFKMIGDLVETLSFATKANKSFDASLGEVVTNAVVTFSLSGVVYQEKRKDSSLLETKAILKLEDLVEEGITDLDVLDTVTIKGILHKITPPIDSNGYTVTITLTRALA